MSKRVFTVTCSLCGKKGFETRKEARSNAKKAHPNAHLAPYECDNGFWHYGHLPPMVADGRWARSDLGQAVRKPNPYSRPATA